MEPLQGGISVSQLQQDPDFMAMSPDLQVQYLNEEFLPKSDPTFSQLPQDLKQQYIQEEVLPQIQPVRGLQGGFGDIQPGSQIPLSEGFGRIAQGIGNWALSVPGQIGNAFQTEGQSSINNPLQAVLDRGNPMNMGAMAIEGARDFLQMPADLFAAGMNTYTGTQDFQPIYNLPSVRDIPMLGEQFGGVMDRNPVTNFVAGNAIPVEGALGLIGRVMKGGSPTARALATAAPRLEAGRYTNAPKRGPVPSGVPAKGVGQQTLEGVQQYIQDAMSYKGIDEKATRQTQNRALKMKYDEMQARSQGAPPQLQGWLKQAQEQLQQQHQGVNPAKPQKMQPRVIQEGTVDFDAMVEYIEGLRAAGRAKEADVALGTVERASKAKIYDAVKRSEKAKSEAKRTQKSLKPKGETVKTEDMLLGALKEINKPKAGTADELRTAGPDEYAQMAKSAGEELKDLKARQKQLAKEESEAIKRQKALEKEAETLFGAIKSATKSPAVKTGTATELKPRVDEYTQMARNAKPFEAEAQRLQDLKRQQAVKDQLALERAESANRRRELKQLAGAIRERANEQKAKAKQQNGAKPQPKKDQPKGTAGKKPAPAKQEKALKPGKKVTSRQAIKGEAAQAAKTGEIVEFDYQAEGGRSRLNEERIVAEGKARDGRTEAKQVGGESLHKSQGVRREVVKEVGITKSGDTMMKTQDETGGYHTRIIEGKGQGSKVNWFRRTGEMPGDDWGMNPGAKSEAAYTSVIKSDVQKMQSVLDRLKRGEEVPNQEIMDAARPMKENEFIRHIDDMPEAQRKKLSEEFDCS